MKFFWPGLWLSVFLSLAIEHYGETAFLPKNYRTLSSGSGYKTPSNYSQCLEILSRYYSSEQNKFLPEKLKKSKKSVHMFMRAHPPLFYEILIGKFQLDSRFQDFFKRTLPFKGVIVGDMHMENVGTKLNKKKLILGVNDFDDLTKGPLVYDLIRHLTSYSMALPDSSPKEVMTQRFMRQYLEAYQKGLQRKTYTPSEFTKKFLAKKNKELAKKMPEDSRYVDSALKKFREKKEPFFSTPKVDFAELQRIVAELKLGTITDHYMHIKPSGGSAGLKRFQLVVDDQSTIQWIEIKEWDMASYQKIQGKTSSPNQKDFPDTEPSPNFQERIQWIQSYGDTTPSPELVSIHNQNYLLRFKNPYEDGVQVDDLDEKELELLLFDQAYLLGIFHGSLSSIHPQFMNALAPFEEVILQLVFSLKNELEQIHQASLAPK